MHYFAVLQIMCTFIAHLKADQRLCSDLLNFAKYSPPGPYRDWGRAGETPEIMAQKPPRDFLVIFQSGQKILKVDRNEPTASRNFWGGTKSDKPNMGISLSASPRLLKQSKFLCRWGGGVRPRTSAYDDVRPST